MFYLYILLLKSVSRFVVLLTKNSYYSIIPIIYNLQCTMSIQRGFYFEYMLKLQKYLKLHVYTIFLIILLLIVNGTHFHVGDGKTWLTDNWRLCKPLNDKNDVVILKQWAAEVYVALAMVNYPYEANFLAPLPANPIKVIVFYSLILLSYTSE